MRGSKNVVLKPFVFTGMDRVRTWFLGLPFILLIAYILMFCLNACGGSDAATGEFEFCVCDCGAERWEWCPISTETETVNVMQADGTPLMQNVDVNGVSTPQAVTQDITVTRFNWFDNEDPNVVAVTPAASV